MYKYLMFFTLLIAVGLRFSLALVNREANDDHLEVSRIMLLERRLPDREDCWECFQPKLYHTVMAWIFQVLSVEGKTWEIVFGQMMNVIAGLGTMIIILLFVDSLPVTNLAKYFSFALAVLNPKLIAINVMATNDSFVIFFSTLAIFTLYRYLSSKNLLDFAVLSISTILAGLSKGNGLIVFLGVVLVFIVRSVVSYSLPAFRRITDLTALLGLSLLFLLIVPYFGQYVHNYQAYRSPFVTNIEKDSPPRLFQLTEVQWPGVTSISQSYFTFRLFDLLAKPYIIHYQPDYPLHMTSLWTQLYAGAHFTHFDSHPRSWKSDSSIILYVGRIIYVLALMPVFYLLTGYFNALKSIFSNVARRKKFLFLDTKDWIFSVFFTGFLLFIISYTFQYRSFNTMKVIYIYPSLLSIIYFFAQGYSQFNRVPTGSPQQLLFSISTGILLGLYVVEMVHLLIQLVFT
jgi:hypothetical protein